MHFGKRVIVSPAKGMTVMDEYARVVPEDGAIVRWSSHWQRRLNEGAIKVSEMKEPAKPKPATKSRKKPTNTDTENSE